jgi:hypothetical protein
MYATNFFETKILNLARGTSITAPVKMYLGLFLNNPTDIGGGTEISYSGYSRKEIAFDAPIASGTGLSIQNTSVISFAESPSLVGSVGYIGIFDALSGGNMWLYGQLGTPLNVQTGVSPVVRVGTIKYVMSGNLNTYYRTAILNTLRGFNCPGFFPYYALMTGNPDSGGIEFSGSGYARTAIAFGDPSEQANGNMQISNTALATTPESTGLWGTLSHISLYDAPSNGNPFITVQLNMSYDMIAGSVCQFQVGAFKVNIN